MRVTTRITIGPNGNILEHKYFEYSGPVALCGGPSGTINKEQDIAQQQVNAGNKNLQQQQQLTGQFMPYIQQSGNYYRSLASGDPQKMFAAIAPAAQQIGAQSQAAQQQIQSNTPRGGVQQLAMDQARNNAAAQTSQLMTGGYTGANQALGQMGAQGLGLGTNIGSLGLSGLGGGANTYGNVAQQQAQAQQALMSALGGLAGIGGGLGATALQGHAAAK